ECRSVNGSSSGCMNPCGGWPAENLADESGIRGGHGTSLARSEGLGDSSDQSTSGVTQATPMAALDRGPVDPRGGLLGCGCAGYVSSTPDLERRDRGYSHRTTRPRSLRKGSADNAWQRQPD